MAFLRGDPSYQPVLLSLGATFPSETRPFRSPCSTQLASEIFFFVFQIWDVNFLLILVYSPCTARDVKNTICEYLLF